MSEKQTEITEEKAAGRVPVPNEKLKALQAAMEKIEKNYGRGAVSYTHLTLPTIA